MRNATTVRIFAVLIGFVLARPAGAEAQNSSTPKPGPVATDKVTSSCSSASTLVDPSRPAPGGISIGFSTPRDATAVVLPSVISTPAATCRPLSALCSQNRQCCSSWCYYPPPDRGGTRREHSPHDNQGYCR